MAKINIEASEAITELKKLGTGLKEVRDEMKQLNTISASTFTNLEKGLNNLGAANKRLGDLVKTLSKNLRQNTTQVKHNNEAVKKNTTAINTLTPAIEKLNKSKSKNTKTTKEQTDAYKILVAETKKAEAEARRLTVEMGKGSAVTKDAVSSYRKLKQQLEDVNQSVRKTDNAYEQLSKETIKAGNEAKNLITIHGRQAQASQDAISKYNKLKEKLNETSLSVRKLKDSYTKLTEKVSVAKRKVQNLTIEQGKNSRETKRAVREWKKLQSQLDKTNRSTSKASGGIKKLWRSVASLAGKLGFVGLVAGLVAIGKSLFDTIRKFDTLNFTILKVTKNSFELAQTNIFLQQLVDKFGVSLIVTTNRWIKFSAAARNSGLTLKTTQDIFRSMTKVAAVLGLQTDELRGVYLALEQMLSKGKVTTEELRRQLGERLPGAMGIMASSMGITITKLDEMLKKGEVMSAEVLPNFARAMELAFGVEKVEDIDNLNSAIGRLEGKYQLFVDKVINSEGKVSSALTGILDTIGSMVDILTLNWASDAAVVEFRTVQVQDDIRLQEDNFAKMEAQRELGVTLIKLRNDVAQAQSDITRRTLKYEKDIRNASSKEQKAQIKKDSKDEFLALEEQIRLKSNALNDFEHVRILKLRESAAKILESEEADAIELRKVLFPDGGSEAVDFLKTFERTGDVNGRNEFYFKIKLEGGKEFEQTERGIYNTLANMESRVNIAKLNLEQGTLKTPNFEEEETTPKTKKLLNEIKDLELEIQNAKVKDTIAANNKILASDRNTLKERLELLNENRQLQEESAKIDFNIKRRDIGIDETKKIKGVNSVLDVDTVGGEKAKTNQIKKIKKESQQKLIIAETQFQSQMKNLRADGITTAIEQVQDEIDRKMQLYSIEYNNKIAQAKRLTNKNVTDIQGKFTSGEITSEEQNSLLILEKERFEEQMTQIEFDGVNARIKLQVKLIKAYIATSNIQGKALNDANALVAKLEASLNVKSPKTNKDKRDSSKDMDWKEKFQLLANAASEFFDGVGALGNALFNARIQEIDEELQANEDKYARLLELAKNDEAETEIILRNKALAEEALFKKKKDLQIKQAKFDKAISIVQATINGAGAVVQALNSPVPLNVPLAIITGAAAALQIAAIVATPIPAFAKGGVMTYDGKAQINDGGNQEYIERNGGILTTMQTNAIVDLKKGDIIHKDYESLNKNSMIVSTLANGGQLTESDFERMYSGIEKSIEKGFNKARINNKVTVLNKVDTYRDKMQNWS